MTAVGMLDEEKYIGAEHQYNIFTVRLSLALSWHIYTRALCF